MSLSNLDRTFPSKTPYTKITTYSLLNEEGNYSKFKIECSASEIKIKKQSSENKTEFSTIASFTISEARSLSDILQKELYALSPPTITYRDKNLDVPSLSGYNKQN